MKKSVHSFGGTVMTIQQKNMANMVRGKQSLTFEDM